MLFVEVGFEDGKFRSVPGVLAEDPFIPVFYGRMDNADETVGVRGLSITDIVCTPRDGIDRIIHTNLSLQRCAMFG